MKVRGKNNFDIDVTMTKNFSKINSMIINITKDPSIILKNKKIIYFKNRIFYSAVANPDKILEIKLEDINFFIEDKILIREFGPGEIIKSFNNMEIRDYTQVQKESLKYKAIYEHFIDGIPWEKTDLFTVRYKTAFKNQGTIRKSQTIEDLLKDYYNKIDPLYENIKKFGIKLPSKEEPDIEYIYVHIGPKGELMYTSNGNHRFYIAKILGVQIIPCKVWWRHKKWQKIREKCAHLSKASIFNQYPRLINHPDLHDIICTKRGIE